MRLRQLTEQINEVPLFVGKEATPEDIEAGATKVADIIKKECRPYLEQKRPRRQLYRGLRNYGTYTYAMIKNVREDRRPKDSSNLQNTFFIDLIAHKGCKANRNNSTFATTSTNIASDYGTPHIIFPIGDFHFTWGFKDMTEDIREFDLVLYNRYSYRVYKEAMDKMQAGQEIIENLPKATDPEMWTEKSPEMKAKIEQAVKDMNIVPTWEGLNALRNLSPSEQRAWNWEFTGNLLEQLKSEKDSTLDEAMGSAGEIMISCKQYIALRDAFFTEHIQPRIE